MESEAEEGIRLAREAVRGSAPRPEPGLDDAREVPFDQAEARREGPAEEVTGTVGGQPVQVADLRTPSPGDQVVELILERVTRVLPTELTEDEILSTAKGLADVLREQQALARKHEDLKKGMKREVELLASRQVEYAMTLREGKIHKEVAVHIIGSRASGQAKVVRLDTGEVVAQRPLTDAEKQRLGIKR